MKNLNTPNVFMYLSRYPVRIYYNYNISSVNKDIKILLSFYFKIYIFMWIAFCSFCKNRKLYLKLYFSKILTVVYFGILSFMIYGISIFFSFKNKLIICVLPFYKYLSDQIYFSIHFSMIALLELVFCK